MGACDYQTTSHGKTPADAYRNACDEARDINGHQEGYSGDIQTSSGYREYALPKGINAQRMLGWVSLINEAVWADEDAHSDERELDWDGILPSRRRDLEKRIKQSRAQAARARKRVPAAHRGTATRIANDIRDKCGPAVCLQVTGKAATEYKRHRGISGTRAKVWLFAGTGAC